MCTQHQHQIVSIFTNDKNDYIKNKFYFLISVLVLGDKKTFNKSKIIYDLPKIILPALITC